MIATTKAFKQDYWLIPVYSTTFHHLGIALWMTMMPYVIL